VPAITSAARSILGPKAVTRRVRHAAKSGGSTAHHAVPEIRHGIFIPLAVPAADADERTTARRTPRLNEFTFWGHIASLHTLRCGASLNSNPIPRRLLLVVCAPFAQMRSRLDLIRGQPRRGLAVGRRPAKRRSGWFANARMTASPHSASLTTGLQSPNVLVSDQSISGPSSTTSTRNGNDSSCTLPETLRVPGRCPVARVQFDS
jgi:hypothetical protein